MSQEQSNPEIKFLEHKIKIISAYLIGTLISILIGIIIAIKLAFALVTLQSNYQKLERSSIEEKGKLTAQINDLETQLKKATTDKADADTYSEVVSMTNKGYFDDIESRKTEIIKLQSQLAQAQEQKKRLKESLKACKAGHNQ